VQATQRVSDHYITSEFPRARTAARPGLPDVLSWKDAFLFPVGTPEGRRDVFIGGLAILCLLPIGWVLNLGARLDVVQRLYHNDKPFFRGFRPWRRTFVRGCVSAATILCYLLPSLLLADFAFFGYLRQWQASIVASLAIAALAAFVVGVFTLPGCMTVYACEGDAAVLRRPVQAFRRALAHRHLYFKAWGISLSAVALSFFGLLALVVGFIFASVWSWEVVGYAFTVAMYGNPEPKRQ
jgi:hypothetical protein